MEKDGVQKDNNVRGKLDISDRKEQEEEDEEGVTTMNLLAPLT